MTLPGPLAAANGLPGTEGEGTNVMPDNGIAWLTVAAATDAGLFGELALGVAVGTGLEAAAGEAVAGVAGMSYFCSCRT